jgi:hypothetical protein
MPHVTGVGGLFFKSKGDPRALANWYGVHLGIKIGPWGGAIFESPMAGAKDIEFTAWNIDGSDTEKYRPSKSSF